MTKPIAIIGGGLAGLTCAIRLAERGRHVRLFEAAPTLGGRTRSHFDEKVDEWVDNGPHLLIGAYRQTRQLMQDIGAADNISWQPSLHLPLFDVERGHFSLTPNPWLPFPLALLIALYRMPGHGISSIKSMITLASGMKKPSDGTVAAWLQMLAIEPVLVCDLIEPLCIGAMNESMEHADVQSFIQVMQQTFASHDSARLGWFNRPLSQALIAPLEKRLVELGGQVSVSTPIHKVTPTGDSCTLQSSSGESGPYAHAVIALSAYARDKLLGLATTVQTSPITNVHLWFDPGFKLPEPLTGSINSRSQWFFDVSRQTGVSDNGLSHICAVISADVPNDREQLMVDVLKELSQLSGKTLPSPLHSKIICEKRATVLTRRENSHHSSGTILDASEAPLPGEIPATIEGAVIRGEEAANTLCFQQEVQVIHR